MPTFMTPGLPVVPPVSYAERRNGPTTEQQNPQGYRLMRWFYNTNSSFRRYRGVNVWRMNDGTYWMSDPVPGVGFTGTIGWPYPDTDNPVNDAISSSWFSGGPGGVGGSGPGGLIQYVVPGIDIEYLGGHIYNITNATAVELEGIGLGGYVGGVGYGLGGYGQSPYGG